MGLMYTKFHLYFDETNWLQISHNPIVFQATKNDSVLEIDDVAHKLYKLHFKKGGKLNMFRVTGQFRLTWDDADLID